MSVKHRPKYRKEVSLVPGGILQFFDLAINVQDKTLSKIRSDFWEYPDSDSRDKYWLRSLRFDDYDDQWIDRQTLRTATDPRTDSEGNPGSGKKIEPAYSINAQKAIQPFLGRWMPLPVFRTEDIDAEGRPRFSKGPTDWARVHISEIKNPDTENMTHAVTVVFDTCFDEDPDVYDLDDGDDIAQLTQDDLDASALYVLAHDVLYSSWWLSREWVTSWIKEAYLDFLRANARGRPVREEEWDNKVEYLARYITFIDVLHAADILPRVRLTRVAHSAPVGVDLVLDIGNSRTCGMLVERASGKPSSMNDSSVLEIRDLSLPQNIYREPFNSHVSFYRANFHDSGDDLGAELNISGRTQEGFDWPSIVRIGPEASRLSARSRREEGQTSMSSPKRYLWDRDVRPTEWRFCPISDSDHARELPVTMGSYVLHVSDCGAPVQAFESKNKNRELYAQKLPDEYAENPVFNPVFSRSSLMMFLLSEVIMHALVQINSPAYRSDHSNPDIPRRLRNVILTVPTAMPIAERKILQKWASWAIDTLWRSLRWSELDDSVMTDYRQRPSVRCDWDEATATQLVYLYNEVAEKFAGDVDAYFQMQGRKRDGFDRETLRIASIDIGGGTTDLIITTYENKTQGAAGVITPVQEFREGFNVAGDDILKAVIENHVFSQLRDRLETAGVKNARELLKKKFGNSAMPERDKNLRVQFVNQVAVPFGLEILSYVETADPWVNGQTVVLSYTEVFEKHPEPSNEIIEFAADIARDGGSADFDIRDLQLEVKISDVSTTISTVMSPVLADLSEIIGLYDCDKLLLAGRPSRLPVVHAELLHDMAVPPTCFVSLSQYGIGHWYPFWSPGGRISDPKTTACVGAVLCVLAEGNLENFRFETSDLKVKSTARYMGELEASGQIKASNVLFPAIDMDATDAVEHSGKTTFNAPIYLGYRQLKAERWSATPYCYLSFSSETAVSNAIGKMPYTFNLKFLRSNDEAAGVDPEKAAVGDVYGEGVIVIEEGSIMDKNNETVSDRDLTLRLKTMREEVGYWIDTGVMDIR